MPGKKEREIRAQQESALLQRRRHVSAYHDEASVPGRSMLALPHETDSDDGAFGEEGQEGGDPVRIIGT